MASLRLQLPSTTAKRNALENLNSLHESLNAMSVVELVQFSSWCSSLERRLMQAQVATVSREAAAAHEAAEADAAAREAILRAELANASRSGAEAWEKRAVAVDLLRQYWHVVGNDPEDGFKADIISAYMSANKSKIFWGGSFDDIPVDDLCSFVRQMCTRAGDVFTVKEPKLDKARKDGNTFARKVALLALKNPAEYRLLLLGNAGDRWLQTARKTGYMRKCALFSHSYVRAPSAWAADCIEHEIPPHQPGQVSSQGMPSSTNGSGTHCVVLEAGQRDAHLPMHSLSLPPDHHFRRRS